MEAENPHVSIILLNWNGWQDTLECLESVLKLEYSNFNVILIDNDSKDDSIHQIKKWSDGTSDYRIDSKYQQLIRPEVKKPVKMFEIDIKNWQEWGEKKEKSTIVLIRNSENSGFAIANNLGMDIAKAFYNSDYYFLLNNDTVIEKHALKNLVDIMKKHPDVAVAQSTLISYEENKVVNAGGRILFWGQTKYYEKITRDEVKYVTSVSGCALFLRARIVSQFGKLSTKFFHGEEDFEFSLRMKKNQQKMISSGGSLVYHKVSVSVKKMMQDHERRTFLFALNRIVDLKDYYPRLIWYIWRIPALKYFAYLFWIRYHVPLRRTLFLLVRLYFYTNELKNVNNSTVEKVYREMNFL
jgi:GT2 family glycosyltransferase